MSLPVTSGVERFVAVLMRTLNVCPLPCLFDSLLFNLSFILPFFLFFCCNFIFFIIVSSFFCILFLFTSRLCLSVCCFLSLSIQLALAECDDSLPFSGASSIPLCYVPFPATLLCQLFFHPLSLHLAIYFLVYVSILFPNSYIIFKYIIPTRCTSHRVYLI